ncbi:Sulfate adenylyltransferase [Candidatus Magnetaquicoccaceae bacterium FCR-1]|uniref:Sulfate adenylyltransferase n=1 Tax=Candidatus Magnetaquiglobus chichijimensis TaxID=3141448 RepID=A0ABQ0CD19_9PROT
MSKLVPPHGGGELKPLMLAGDALKQAKARAKDLDQIKMSSREACDLIMLGIGAFTPLDGFMGHEDWKGVCENMRLTSGVFWPIPVTLSTTHGQANNLKIGQEVALVDEESGEIGGIITITEKYTIDKGLECRSVFGTEDKEHPGVLKVMEQPEVNIAGPVVVLSEGEFPTKYGNIYMRPSQTRELFEEKGWSQVAAFQTRNPMHRSHEFLAKIAVETMDGVLIHQILGKLKAGDIPAEVRAEAIDTLIDNYFVKDTVIQAGYPMEMRYAGPREALLHAVFRQNYGCSHLIVGRDHAGVGDYYGPFDAQHIFDKVSETDLRTRPLKIDWTFYCYKCQGMASLKTCPHGKDDRLLLSGTKLRKMLSEGEQPPAEFSRPEVVKILQAYYASLNEGEKVEVKLHKAATG